jgi:hypothetical protein
MGGREFSAVNRTSTGEDAESLFAAVGGMQRYVPAEVSAPAGEPINTYPSGQFVIEECPGGYEGRTRPLPGSVAVSSKVEIPDLDKVMTDDDAKLREHLGQTADVETRLTETLQQALQQGEQ